jgi:transposase
MPSIVGKADTIRTRAAWEWDDITRYQVHFSLKPSQAPSFPGASRRWLRLVPPKSNRLHPWDYDHAVYKKRNEIERLFRRLKGFRRIFSRFGKLDALFPGFLSFALIVEALRVV